MPTLKEITAYLEHLAPPALAEDYDNVGLLYGDPGADVTAAITCLDLTPQIVQEAVDTGAQLVIAHHPLIFKGLKRIDPRHWAGRALELAIRHGVALYALHTNLDNVLPGVNSMLAERLGLDMSSLKPLRPLTGALAQMVTYVPPSYKDAVLAALYAAGAGQIGNYADCSFASPGTGTYTPKPGANPTQGQIGTPELADEVRLELTLPRHFERAVLQALFASHPYEEVAYSLIHTQNPWQQAGAGAVGTLPTPMPLDDFLGQVCKTLQLPALKYTPYMINNGIFTPSPFGEGRDGAGHLPSTDKAPLSGANLPTDDKAPLSLSLSAGRGRGGVGGEGEVHTIALCGGAGSFLIEDAIRAGAQAYITGDLKHHELLEAQGRICLIDVGHFESEVGIADWLAARLREKFVIFAARSSGRMRGPVDVFIP